MPSIERTPNQKRLRIVAAIALILSIAMILLGVMFLFFFGLSLSDTAVESMVQDGIETDMIDLARGAFAKIAGYFMFVGISLQVSAIYGIRAARNAIVAVRMQKAVAVTMAASVLGILWTGLISTNAQLLPVLVYIVTLAIELGMLQLARLIQQEATGELAEAVEHERNRKKLPREERLADPNHLGFLRAIQVFFALNIVFTVIGLIFASRNHFSYGFDTLIQWANIIFESVAFYLLINRMRTARRWVIGYSLFNIVANTVHIMSIYALGNEKLGYSLLALFFSIIGDLVVVLYFLRSDRVRILLTNDLSLEVDSSAVADMRHGKPFIRNLVLYYCIFSTLGHWMEAGFCYLVSLGLFQGDIDFGNTMLFRDWLYPFPMHGIAVVLVALILWPLKEALRRRFDRWTTLGISFLVNMLFCTAIEFTGGMLFNRNLQLWNYTDIPFNFMGQICLQNAIGFGVAATLIVYVVYPYLELLIARIPPDIMNVVSVGIFAFYAILMALYVIDFSPEAAAANAANIATMAPLLLRL